MQWNEEESYRLAHKSRHQAQHSKYTSIVVRKEAEDDHLNKTRCCRNKHNVRRGCSNWLRKATQSNQKRAKHHAATNTCAHGNRTSQEVSEVVMGSQH